MGVFCGSPDPCCSLAPSESFKFIVNVCQSHSDAGVFFRNYSWPYISAAFEFFPPSGTALNLVNGKYMCRGQTRMSQDLPKSFLGLNVVEDVKSDHLPFHCSIVLASNSFSPLTFHLLHETSFQLKINSFV